ncbi:MAG: hypothetical protein K1X74_14475 [Pirellulales bacterium]|nr:hypothetical protein [Pirellulales bacterium]
MAKPSFSSSQLEAFLEEALPIDEIALIEGALRQDPALLKQLTAIHSRRDAGVHTLGEIWRRHRASCPSREQLGSFLLGAIDPTAGEYVEFHLQTVGCRWCQANLADLNNQKSNVAQSAVRRRKYFQSSAGLLGRR